MHLKSVVPTKTTSLNLKNMYTHKMYTHKIYECMNYETKFPPNFDFTTQLNLKIVYTT